MTAPRYYAGIGSCETPQDVLRFFRKLGRQLAEKGFVLRSGGAPGADQAFEHGCDARQGPKQIFIPWPGFERRHVVPGVVFAGNGPKAHELAAQFHPYWKDLTPGSRKLIARDGYQVLGPKLDEPVDFIACWTRGGRGQGGTGQAIRIATHLGIPVFDFGVRDRADVLARLEALAFQ